MWEYRVIKTIEDDFENFSIHEVYDDINLWSVNGIEPLGETLAELREDLKMMLRALDKPVLEEVNDKLVEVKR